MTGYVHMRGSCRVCGAAFNFHPNKVPSFEGEPVCHHCMLRINAKRAEIGNPPFPILDGAYEPCPEEEVDWDGGPRPLPTP